MSMATVAKFVTADTRAGRDARTRLDAEFDIALRYLLPDPIVHSGGRIEALQAPLDPAEAVFIRDAVERRVQEFTAGRRCARAVLETLGVSRFALRMGARREPLWPETVVGSISHAAGYCVAAACPRERAAGIGVDIEAASPLPEALIDLVCTPREKAWCLAQPEQLAGLLAKFHFSAKEAVFKCLYPLFGEELEFEDVVLALDLNGGRFRAAVAGGALGRDADLALDGRLACTSCLLLTAVTVTHADLARAALPEPAWQPRDASRRRPYAWCWD